MAGSAMESVGREVHTTAAMKNKSDGMTLRTIAEDAVLSQPSPTVVSASLEAYPSDLDLQAPAPKQQVGLQCGLKACLLIILLPLVAAVDMSFFAPFSAARTGLSARPFHECFPEDPGAARAPHCFHFSSMTMALPETESTTKITQRRGRIKRDGWHRRAANIVGEWRRRAADATARLVNHALPASHGASTDASAPWHYFVIADPYTTVLLFHEAWATSHTVVEHGQA